MTVKVALVADWLPTFAGAEHVIAELCRIWPDAPIFTTVANHGHLGPLDTCDIRTSGLQKWYQLLGNHKVLLPWMPRAIEHIDLRGFDLIVSSSHAVGKGIIPPSDAIHVCYCHTPMRYAWEMEQEYLRDFRIPSVLRRRVRNELTHLRRWDLSTAKRVDVFLANSSATQERIRRIYARQASVVPPPVEDRFFDTSLIPRQKRDEYFFAIGRLVPYKRFDLLIQAANAAKFPLKIAGIGQDFLRLQKMAGSTVELLGHMPAEALPDLYARAKGLLFPQHEDAGVVPLEAQASGTPVIAYGKGGSTDTVKDGRTGTLFEAQTTRSLMEAMERLAQMEWNAEQIRDHARQFCAEDFRNKILHIAHEAIAKKLVLR